MKKQSFLHHLVTDIVLLISGALLIATIAGFLTGFLPYPIGILVLSILFIMRIIYLKQKQD